MQPSITRQLASFVLVAGGVSALVGCGGSDSGPDGASTAAADLVAVMVDQGAPPDQAECVANELDGVSVGELTDFFESVNAGEEVVATEGVAKQFINASVFCEVSE